ncbi:hypothetical protein DFO73_1082 [Cytobacillus oceanisediminis]|uniref:Uncharacterized protein n=1 Tax=Cytobacillus oceanisediminis TaxID=665099 RepID=A0A2V2ZXR8_9BACI|nr:hypothetical protein [Cytobacillus oceanisediminis]PWW27265.1 hypothetical protein DFO73_1082 [Cytobacillus oceanisediminis]
MAKKKIEIPKEKIEDSVEEKQEEQLEEKQVEQKQVEQKQEEQLEERQVEQLEVEPPKKYIVVHDFRDLKDNNAIYFKGDIYPKGDDVVVDEQRIKELSTTKNKIGKVLIKEQD